LKLSRRIARGSVAKGEYRWAFFLAGAVSLLSFAALLLAVP
jgi:hypothetical protein